MAAFNPGPMLDALDEERSSVVRFSSGRVMDIERYVFDTAHVPERGAFKIIQDPTGPVFFTEALAEDLADLGLNGLDFEAVGEFDQGQDRASADAAGGGRRPLPTRRISRFDLG